MPSGVEEVRPEEPAAVKAESVDTPALEEGKEVVVKQEEEKEESKKDVTSKDDVNVNAGEEEEGKGGEESQRQEQVGSKHSGEEGVEVVLGEQGTSKVVEDKDKNKERSAPDQNVFRHPQEVRPRTMRGGGPPQHPPPSPYSGSGSWGYGPQHYGQPPPPPRPHEYPSRPYPVPPYGSSSSFDDQGSYHRHATPHYSPHVQYPPPQGRYGDDVNVISPNHKGDPHYRPSLTPRPRHMPQGHGYYQYPPTSPVSRPGGAPPSGPPRVRDYAMSRRPEGPYSKAQRPGGEQQQQQQHPEDGTWNSYGRSPSGDMSNASRGRPQLPLVTESSFDSRSLTSTPKKPTAPMSSDPVHPSIYAPGSWGSFDSAPPPPPHFDGYYGQPPPESPYGYHMGPYSPAGSFYHAESFPPPQSYGPSGSFSYSYDEEERNALRDYHPDRDGASDPYLKQVTPPSKGKGRSKSGTPVSSNKSKDNPSSMLLPKAAEEVDFEVTDPPAEPVTEPSDKALCESLADVNTYDVLCGRGGGTNSQIGNRRFRKLVQDFQPTYLLARRKEKPLLARTIVLIIRKRGGRFLKKNEDTGELFEVGDAKAEAKTSQALREGLDVRATKSAASSLLEKKKRNKQQQSKSKDADLDDDVSPRSTKRVSESQRSPGQNSGRYRHHGRPESPPSLPRLQGEEVKPSPATSRSHPSSTPENYRKRRRIRGGYQADRFFPDFCPPRADLGRPASPSEGYMPPHHQHHPHHYPGLRRNPTDDLRLEDDAQQVASSQGCTGIAMDMMSGATAGSFCLGPAGLWRR